jgi:predicted Rossmann fold nucleotide-binding protein DprA/Smf involved in DNA uptake
MMDDVTQEPQVSRDTQAVLLLCSRFAPREQIEPLDTRELSRVEELLQQRSLRPGDLLDDADLDWAASGLETTRIAQLLDRAMGLGLATERWANGGLWVISRSDDDYPARLLQHLGRSAPPLLWGVGERSLPASGGIAIVGSREIDDDAAKWAEDVAAACARQAITVISGGARGTDQIATAAALNEGGRVIGVLPEGLGRPSVVGRYREAVVDGRLLLLSSVYPDAGFTIGNAMGRNKVIYGIAEVAVIVRADANSGGTWAGAEAELKREDAIPVFVRAEGAVAEGNRALIALGAQAFPTQPWEDMRALLASPARETAHGKDRLPIGQIKLFGA